MKKENIYILGAGGMARELKSYYVDLGESGALGGFVEQQSHRAGTSINGVVVIDASELPSFETSRLIGGIGNPIRKKWIEELEAAGYEFDTLIHNTAYIGDNSQIGEGGIICPQAVITTDVSLGRHCIINVKASVSHDCKLGDYVTVSPGASIGGGVGIGDETWIGIGATVIHRIKIGKRVFIAAGAVIVEDVPDDSLVIGVPGKVVRKLSAEDWKVLI